MGYWFEHFFIAVRNVLLTWFYLTLLALALSLLLLPPAAAAASCCCCCCFRLLLLLLPPAAAAASCCCCCLLLLLLPPPPAAASSSLLLLLLLLLPPAAAAAGANISPKKKITVSVALFGAGGRYGRETQAERGNVYRRQNLWNIQAEADVDSGVPLGFQILTLLIWWCCP